jgi:transposase
VLTYRTTETASGKVAVQVVSYRRHKVEVIKHIGSGEGRQEIIDLKKIAHQFIVEKSKLVSLFPEQKKYDSDLVSIKKLIVERSYHCFSYEVLTRFYNRNGFNVLNNKLLKDLSIVRIVKPSSKFEAIKLLKKYFNIAYTRNKLYKKLPNLRMLKSLAEEAACSYALRHLKFDFTLVFYDVTTLYFESFKDDEFRKCGYSKDGKSGQPQILVSLVVNKDGYPIAYDIFCGNKFEGHTFIPSILRLKEKYKIQNLTVVADAGMMSRKNIKDLVDLGINYIVAARLANMTFAKISEISLFFKSDKRRKYYRKKEDNQLLICDYSKARAGKDRQDREKQITKAINQINNPAKGIKRLRFLSSAGKQRYILNQRLIEKDKLLDGLKGYYTNLFSLPEWLIVKRYKDLWKIEKAFRIAKSDLEARPIFERKEETIQTHILIVFLSLCVSKSFEIAACLSIKKIKDFIWEIEDIPLYDSITGKKYLLRTKIPYDEYPEKLRRILKG